ENYTMPTVLMYYKGNNTTVSRTEPIEVMTVVSNNNPLEMRRMLDIYLEVKDPGSSEFERMNTWPEKIQTNEYNEKNTSFRIWGLLPSFSYLKQIGTVRIRANASDGVNKWSTASYPTVKPPFYTELIFNVTNSQPEMKDFDLTPDGPVRYNDPIEYKATISDSDEDLLNVTLHIIDEQGKEEVKGNITLQTKPGPVSFKANEYGFFKEADAGKNFTYYYSFDDGMKVGDRIEIINTDLLPGPAIRKGPKLSVDKLDFSSASENYYWWERYGFDLRAKNLNPEVYKVSFTLSTKTEGSEWTTVDTVQADIGENPVEVHFNDTRPFKVTDAGKTFYYRVKYSEYDQTGKDSMEQIGSQINGKIVPYSIHNPVMVLNLVPMLLAIMLGSFLIERKLKKGMEAHENAKVGIKKGKNGGDSGESLADRVFKMLRRR
ncbi:MAG TPA: hypothetical protein PLJ25_04720, partial [Methanothrix sp.]|nr:hypothetical protein [Methanothrix sp.]